jgi:hypothetical protein
MMDGLNNCKHATVVCSFFFCEESVVHFERDKVEWIDTLILGEEENR